MSVMTLERGAARPPAAARPMPGGIAFSAVLHLAVFALVLLGLPNLFRRPPPEDMPIAVELVMIAPETRATHPNPYKPKAEAKPEPAVAPPTAAPEPKPQPEPPQPVPEPPPSAAAPPPLPAPPVAKPEIKAPPLPPPPPPPPKPVEAQPAPPPSPPPPPRPPEPKPKPEPQQAAHVAAKPETKKPDPLAFAAMMKNLTEHPEKKPDLDFDAVLKNLTREQTAQAEDAPPQPRRHQSAAVPPSSQPKAPLGSQLTASEIDLVREQLRPCFNPPIGAKEKPDLTADIRVVMNRDGTVQQAHIVDPGQYASDPIYRAIADSGTRALRNPRCTPLLLPPDRYDVWQTFVFGFSTKDMQ